VKKASLELRHLRTFVALIDAGSMTAAAERLGVGQSTISEAVTALERALGARAISRRRGAPGVELTAAGIALLPHARSMLASLEDAYVAVASAAHDVYATIELVANESVSTYLLPPALAILREKWPNVRFPVTIGMCPNIYEGLNTGRFDAGLMLQVPRRTAANTTAPEKPPAERARHVCDVPLVVFSSAKHPLINGTTGHVLREQLAPHPVFVSDANGYFHTFLRDFFHGDGVTGPRLEPTGSVEAVKRSVLAHPTGLGVLPQFAVADELRSGLVQPLPLRPPLPQVRLDAMTYRRREPLHPAIAELLDVLQKV
jgi:DNA-binding transcriptional LysR family regulator